MPQQNVASAARQPNPHNARDPADVEREAAVEGLKQRCRSEFGIQISGQDLQRVAGHKEANTLHKWLKRGDREKGLCEAVDLPTGTFVEQVLRLRPRKHRNHNSV